MAHSQLSPSSAHRWLRCPGSVKACAELPNRGSAASREGTIAHELAEIVLNKVGASCFDYEGKCLPGFEDFTITREMCENVQTYVDYVKAISGEHFYVVRVDFSDWVKDGYGTSDVVVLSGSTLYVIDLKYGKGVQVFAEGNEQAQLYALGALSDNFYKKIQKVVCVIVQPRLDHIDEWETTPQDLFKFGEYVSQRAELCLTDDAERVPGDKQCTFCLAKATCPALKRFTEKTILTAFEDLDVKPIETLGDEQLKRVLDNKKLIISWFDAIEKMVSYRLNEGQPFEGYKLVAGRSLRLWGDESKAEERLTDLLGEKAHTKKLLSVAQAEKVLGKANKAEIDDLIVKPEGKPTLAPASDKRKALNISVDDFDKLS